MFNNQQIEKLKRFANDSVMNEAVKGLIERAITKQDGLRDVHILAAERLAINVLVDAWKELDKYKSNVGEETKPIRQVGL